MDQIPIKYIVTSEKHIENTAGVLREKSPTLFLPGAWNIPTLKNIKQLFETLKNNGFETPRNNCVTNIQQITLLKHV